MKTLLLMLTLTATSLAQTVAQDSQKRQLLDQLSRTLRLQEQFLTQQLYPAPQRVDHMGNAANSVGQIIQDQERYRFMEQQRRLMEAQQRLIEALTEQASQSSSPSTTATNESFTEKVRATDSAPALQTDVPDPIPNLPDPLLQLRPVPPGQKISPSKNSVKSDENIADEFCATEGVRDHDYTLQKRFFFHCGHDHHSMKPISMRGWLKVHEGK